MIKVAQDAGHLVGGKYKSRGVLMILAFLAIIPCNGLTTSSSHFEESTSHFLTLKSSQENIARFNHKLPLMKRSPLPLPDMFSEPFPEFQSIPTPEHQAIRKPQHLPMPERYQTRFTESHLRPEEDNIHSRKPDLKSSPSSKEVASLTKTNELEMSNPLLHELDKKRKIANLEYQEKAEKLEKAKKERDAIQHWKPKEKQLIGERVSRLTMKNFNVVKAAALKEIDHVKAKKSNQKFQEVKAIAKNAQLPAQSLN